MATKMTTFRLSDTELEQLDEVAHRLGVNRTDAVKHGIFQLRRATGLLGDDAIRLHERIARLSGDDAELVFVITSIPDLAVEVRLEGEPLANVRAHLLYAKAGFEGQPMELQSEGAIVMKDESTGAWYSIGRVELREGAEKNISIRELPDLVQGAHDDRSPEERRQDIAMSSRIRDAAGIDTEADD
jgi:hypothetical protein